MSVPTRVRASVVLLATTSALLAACSGGSTVDNNPPGGDIVTVRAGYVSAIDQIGLPVGLERGFFEDENLDVQLAQPFPTGVDALNALQAGTVDFVQVGVPIIAAAQRDVDLVLLGNYTGSSTRRSIDETMGVVVPASSDVSASDLGTLRGKRIGVSINSINHLYLLGLLESAEIGVDEVTIVNTAPPDMAVALQTDGIDIAIVWDPWPIVIAAQVEGSREVLRGGGYIPFIGYIVSTPEYVAENPDVVERFLTARAATDKWMRDNPQEAAESATRWLPGTALEVAQEAMQYNVEQLDGRFSACNYLALDTISSLLAAQGVVQPGFDVNEYFVPGPILTVMQDRPELFDDLDAIPAGAQLGDSYVFDRDVALAACQ